MKIKKRIVCIVGVILIIVSLGVLLTGCCPSKNKPKHVVIEVINPLTGEPIKHRGAIEFTYDGQPKILEIKLKTAGRRGKYLTDADFENKNMKSHIRLSVRNSDNPLDWPVEPGIYFITIYFNYALTRPKGVIDENYHSTLIDVTIYIYE